MDVLRLEDAIRDITDDEVAYYQEHGWVKLDGLISRDAISRLRKAADDLMDEAKTTLQGEDAITKTGGMGTAQIHQGSNWRASSIDHFGGAQTLIIDNVRTDPFLSLSLNPKLGQITARLFNRISITDEPVGVRYLQGTLFCRAPGSDDASNGTLYHQDFPDLALDRVGALNIWIALEEVTPDQGTMRFLDRSHEAGPLGGLSNQADLLERYPKLPEQYPWAPPLHYRPGDATAHKELLVHGTPANITDKPRLSYVCAYFSADCVVDVPKSRHGFPEPHERFPLVYS